MTAVSRDFRPVFAALRSVMLESNSTAEVVRDEPGIVELAGPVADPNSGRPAWFGMVKTGGRAVSYHLMPIYVEPALAEDLSPELAKRRHGKSCFNFTRVDRELFTELAELTRRCAKEKP